MYILGGYPVWIWHSPASCTNRAICSALNELQSGIDLAISSTCAEPRYDIIKNLIEYGVKLFLIEKIAFQSLAQFDNIIKQFAPLA